MATGFGSADEENRLQVFLKVEPTEDGYIETSLKGERTQYYRHRNPDAIELKNLKAFRTIDPQSGSAKYYVTAMTEGNFRAVGAEKAYPIWDVTLSSDCPRSKTIFRSRYSSKGHPYRTTLEIGLSDDALKEIVQEIRTAPTTRVLNVQLQVPSLIGDSPNTSHDGFGAEKTYLLPYWADQHISRDGEGYQEMVVVEWSFDVSSITVCPELRSSMFGPERSDVVSTEATVSIRGPVGVYHYSQAENDSGTNPLEEQFAKLMRAIEGLRTPLYVIGFGVVLLALKLFL